MRDHDLPRLDRAAFAFLFYGGGALGAVGLWHLLGDRHPAVAWTACMGLIVAQGALVSWLWERHVARAKSRGAAAMLGAISEVEAERDDARLQREVDRELGLLRADDDDPRLRN